jgi:hypothetical protein
MYYSTDRNDMVRKSDENWLPNDADRKKKKKGLYDSEFRSLNYDPNPIMLTQEETILDKKMKK